MVTFMTSGSTRSAAIIVPQRKLVLLNGPRFSTGGFEGAVPLRRIGCVLLRVLGFDVSEAGIMAFMPTA
jgi:hypothetical protein